jgi:hypothetical protein
VEQNMGRHDEVATDSCYSERKINDDFVGNQSQDDALEA